MSLPGSRASGNGSITFVEGEGAGAQDWGTGLITREGANLGAGAGVGGIRYTGAGTREGVRRVSGAGIGAGG